MNPSLSSRLFRRDTLTLLLAYFATLFLISVFCGCSTHELATSSALVADACGGAHDAAADAAPDAPADAAPIMWLRPTTLVDPTGVHIPATVQAPPTCPAAGCPLVLAFHGYGGSHSDALSRLYLTSVPAWAVTVIPDGLIDVHNARYWNATSSCCDLGGAMPDDLGYASALITAASQGYPIDPSQIYTVGWSNGGAMAEIANCGDNRIASAINLSGPPATCGRAVKLLRVHGLADTTIVFSGGTFHNMPVPYVAADLGSTNGCTGFVSSGVMKDYNASVAGNETTIFNATGCGGASVDLYEMAGTNHIPSMKPTWVTDATAWLHTHTK